MRKILPFFALLLASNAWAALAVTGLTSSSSTVDATSYTAASIDPSDNALVFAVAFSRQAVGSTTPTISGNGITWVEEDTTLQGSTNRRITVFRGLVATPSADTPVIDFAGNTQTEGSWAFFQITGTDTSGTNGSGAIVQNPTATTGSGTATSLTLAAFGSANNMAVAFNTHDSTAATTNTTGFTELYDVAVAENAQLIQVEYLLNTTGIAASWSGTQLWGCIAFEVKEAVAASTSQTITVQSE